MAAEEDVGSFDMEAFIDEIRGLPCIWDYTSEAHNNRLEKARAWEGLCQRFCDSYDAMDKKEKAEWVTKLQRKWRSLRDSYNRELKKQNSGVPKHRQYLYFTNLHFLRPLAERRNAENFIGDFDEDEATNHSTDEGRSAPKRKRPNPLNHQQQDDPGKLQHHYLAEFGPKVDMTTVDPNSDGDWHFLVSLYEHFKGIDGRSKLVAKIEILNVIHKYTKPQQTWGYAAGGQYGGNHSGGYAAVTAYGGGARQNAAAARPSRSSSPSGSESE